MNVVSEVDRLSRINTLGPCAPGQSGRERAGRLRGNCWNATAARCTGICWEPFVIQPSRMNCFRNSPCGSRANFRAYPPRKAAPRLRQNRAFQPRQYSLQAKEPPALSGRVTRSGKRSERRAQAHLDFSQSWRDELLARTWEALADLDKQTGSLYFTTLDYRTRHPDTDSAAMAAQIRQGFEQTPYRGLCPTDHSPGPRQVRRPASRRGGAVVAKRQYR